MHHSSENLSSQPNGDSAVCARYRPSDLVLWPPLHKAYDNCMRNRRRNHLPSASSGRFVHFLGARCLALGNNFKKQELRRSFQLGLPSYGWKSCLLLWDFSVALVILSVRASAVFHLMTTPGTDFMMSHMTMQPRDIGTCRQHHFATTKSS